MVDSAGVSSDLKVETSSSELEEDPHSMRLREWLCRAVTQTLRLEMGTIRDGVQQDMRDELQKQSDYMVAKFEEVTREPEVATVGNMTPSMTPRQTVGPGTSSMNGLNGFWMPPPSSIVDMRLSTRSTASNNDEKGKSPKKLSDCDIESKKETQACEEAKERKEWEVNNALKLPIPEGDRTKRVYNKKVIQLCDEQREEIEVEALMFPRERSATVVDKRSSVQSKVSHAGSHAGKIGTGGLPGPNFQSCNLKSYRVTKLQQQAKRRESEVAHIINGDLHHVQSDRSSRGNMTKYGSHGSNKKGSMFHDPSNRMCGVSWASWDSIVSGRVMDQQSAEGSRSVSTNQLKRHSTKATLNAVIRSMSIVVIKNAHKGSVRCRWMYLHIAKMVCSPYFDGFFGVVVMLNSLSIGVQTDYIARKKNATLPWSFRVIEMVFCVMFTAELSMRLFIHRCNFFRMEGWMWNTFDCIVVGLQLIEELLNSLTLDDSWLLNLGAMRALRVVRLIRVVRFIRLIHLISELRTLATSITSSLKSLGWTVVMLCLMIYIIGLIFTQVVTDFRLTDDNNEDADLQLSRVYGSMARSILSLYQAVTGGLDWRDAVDPLLDHISPWLAPVFALYIAFVVLAIMNVVTGVFVESALKSAKEDRETVVVNNVRELFSNGSENENMTWQDFQDQLDNPRMQDYFKTIDVDPTEAEIVFNLLDVDRNGVITADEFANGCLKLIGPAKALDLTILLHEVRALTRALMSIFHPPYEEELLSDDETSSHIPDDNSNLSHLGPESRPSSSVEFLK